ncbi:hypothetical protein BJV82DRAFT_674537 [Fennellomyces sp. T-0311]|nr:hypothetical protein BJV82DRAFT_674537 [Fennellomyces sp. T-0311]
MATESLSRLLFPSNYSADMKVLYFAAARDITQVASDDIDLSSESWSLHSLTDHLVAKYGDALRKVLDHAMYAVNMEYVDKDNESSTQLCPTDEVAIIPPVSGG